MGLLAQLPPTDESIRKGIAHLILTQTTRKSGGASLPETKYTDTGFPGFFYIGYELYSHYFPLMALGRFAQSHALHDQSVVIGKKRKHVRFPVVEKANSATSQDDVVSRSFGLRGGGLMTHVLFACSLSLLCRFWQFTFWPGDPSNRFFVLYFLLHFLSFFLHERVVFFG